MTGAAGFVGAALVRRLLDDGLRVTAWVRPGSDTWRLDGLDVAVEAVDLTDHAAVAGLAARTRPDWVFHLAAHGAYSWQRDEDRIRAVNFTGTAALADACVAAGVEVLVNAGSSSEYGFKDHPPREDELCEPNSAYAAAKAEASAYLQTLGRSSHLRATTLRLYSVYGPWEEPKRLVPTLVVRGLRGELPPLVGPETARDFVYVDDVCEAFVRAAGASDPEPAIYNVGSGRQTTIAEIVETARAVLGIDAEPDWGSMEGRSWDTDVWVSDPTRIRTALGWEATTALARGLELTADWLQTQPALLERYQQEIG